MAERFSIKFEGPGVEDHTIDANMLASSLLALTDLIDDTEALLAPDGPRHKINVRAVDDGSFEVFLELREWLQAAAAFFASETMTATAVLKTLFGGPGLFELLKFLGGRRQPDRTTQRDDMLIVEVDDQQREFSVAAGKLSMNRSVRRNVRKFVQPLGSEDVSDISVEIPQQEALRLTTNDKASLSAPLEDETVTDNTVEMWLTVDTIRFQSSRWAFRDPTTRQLIRASILDERFLEKVDKRTESFYKGDSLYCRVRIQQWETGDGRIDTDHSILEVIDHTGTRGTQDPLPSS